MTTSKPLVADFDAWAKYLRGIYFSARKKRKEVRPRDNAVNALKDALYGYFRALKDARLLDDLEQHIRDNHEPWKGPTPGAAAWVVRLIETGRDSLLDDSSRNRMVSDLMLADQNNVRPEMLLAFIYEAGPIAIRKKALANSEVFDWADRYR